ncbi:MAG TPA: hypothetical protein PKN48_14170 [Bacteroidales bacterium]|nr:hypothetical protein [Bacteroidales bacterium]
MRKMLFFSMAALMLLTFGCVPKSGKNKPEKKVLSKNIEYDVTINNFVKISQSSPEESHWVWSDENIEASSRCAFLDLLFKKALSGKLKLTDMNNKSIDTNKLKDLLSFTDTLTMTRLTPPYNSYDTVVKRTIQASSVTGLRFRENWSYDPKTMAFSKKVIAMAPLSSKVGYDDDGNLTFSERKALFWIVFPEKTKPDVVLTKRIISNVIYHPTDFSEDINVDSLAMDGYINKIMDKAYSDSINAYQYSDESGMWNVPLSGKDLKDRWCSIDTITYSTPQHKHGSYDTIIKHDVLISMIRFLEEWTFDPETMAIDKKVVGICPVTICYDDAGEAKGFKPLFWVYFSDVWMPFGGKLELKEAEKK